MNINERGIWLNNDFEGHLYDEPLAEVLGHFFWGSSVVDLGCGHGTYTYYFRSIGIECDGYDGNPNTTALTGGLCGVMDLSEDAKLERIYDYVLCLEVGEHIPAQYEKTFINNLHKLNRKGIVLSWAIEGQGGEGHVNCHNNDYVRKIFADLGYEPIPDLEKAGRDAAKLWWFKNTLMAFKKPMI